MEICKVDVLEKKIVEFFELYKDDVSNYYHTFIPQISEGAIITNCCTIIANQIDDDSNIRKSLEVYINMDIDSVELICKSEEIVEIRSIIYPVYTECNFKEFYFYKNIDDIFSLIEDLYICDESDDTLNSFFDF